MSVASVAAAKIYVNMHENPLYHETYMQSNEPFRAMVDLGREAGIHSAVDGSEEYEAIIDILEVLIVG